MCPLVQSSYILAKCLSTSIFHFSAVVNLSSCILYAFPHSLSFNLSKQFKSFFDLYIPDKFSPAISQERNNKAHHISPISHKYPDDMPINSSKFTRFTTTSLSNRFCYFIPTIGRNIFIYLLNPLPCIKEITLFGVRRKSNECR